MIVVQQSNVRCPATGRSTGRASWRRSGVLPPTPPPPHPPPFWSTVMSSIVPQDSLYYFENLVVFFVQSSRIGCFVGMLCANTRHLQQQLLEKENHTLVLLNNLAPPSPLHPLVNPHAPPLGTRYMSCWFSMPYQQILLFCPIGTEFLTFV